MRPIKREDCTITLTAEDEDIDPEGQFASDDSEADNRMVDEIRKRRESGDPWAWFCAKVTVACGGLEATDYLGCCSYADEADFKKPGGYYDDMVNGCLDRLNAQLNEITKKLGA